MTERKQGRRSAQDAEKTKCEILRVASELFCSLGYERVSLRNISEQAGVSHSLIRHHFGSKEKIWHAISDNLDRYMENYMHTLIDNMPQNITANVKLYLLSVQLLAHLLTFKQPIQLIADAVRQEDSLFDYFIDNSGELEALVNSIADDYNQAFPESKVKIWEIKWQMIMFAHGAASLAPFMKETWVDETSDDQECLLKHWDMFNQMMVSRLHVPQAFVLQPSSVDELVFELPCQG
ncbi:TetR/AcrR family transcriptional regulator [Vibrio ostreicida]|uniref:TetR/AcrR family transcriptional regulator n=1 Tax=Vibrio ostreicida TaxID=526588 RepID=A0ABT8C0J2_9VIBR|nr:TetR/AcrR family transcriptional regulator [Vibrio ostreicida]MDN3611765.1 TetR/AcrR family transcriptional regulator [Vibrio ostreicida]NPD09580.1 TetR/AcrR family transcriptional regulator [Vibrio ostreicida]